MYTADELEIRCALAGSPRAEQLIACLEGEIAKRDARIVELQRYEHAFNEWHDKTEWVQAESATLSAKYLGCHRADVMRSLIDDLRAELAACRVAVENCDVFRARIAELERELGNSRVSLKDSDAGLLSFMDQCKQLRAELSAIKAQEPVAWAGVIEDCASLFVTEPQLWKAIPLYAAPVSEAKAQGVVQWPEADEIMQMAFEEGHPADDASGYYFELEEFDLFIERLMSEVARLNAAPVQQPKCKTCDDNGRIGGPSFYAPDEGGEPCPDCSTPVQQVSVPAWMASSRAFADRLYMAGWRDHADAQHSGAAGMYDELLAAPAAPAADAWIPVSERLPNIAQEVIVHSEFEGVCAGVLDSYGEWFAPCSEYKLIRVTSWMPLPSAPSAHRAQGVV